MGFPKERPLFSFAPGPPGGKPQGPQWAISTNLSWANPQWSRSTFNLPLVYSPKGSPGHIAESPGSFFTPTHTGPTNYGVELPSFGGGCLAMGTWKRLARWITLLTAIHQCQALPQDTASLSRATYYIGHPTWASLTWGHISVRGPGSGTLSLVPGCLWAEFFSGHAPPLCLVA